ncbi:alpha/beta fold hydrolase [Microlunatus sp. GCM10028923]|uniref:alpha/beta fold hydrolase n=1 Tax=Microlunatus sp. GCM10028923 TaxID=3273400 RepID=UPI00361E33CC
MRTAKTRHLDREFDGRRLHYREAGRPSSTAVLLLHGSPSSSYSFREVLRVLGEYAYTVAPDLPGFGFSDPPPREEFTFDRLATMVDVLLEDLGVERYLLYLTDFSTPVGYLLALRHPDRVLGLVIQNGNAHEAGLGAAWASVRRFWADPSEANRAALPEWLNFEGTRDTYLSGLRPELRELHPAESWHLDWDRLSRPGFVDLHFRLFCDYRQHVARFAEIADYHATWQPPGLVLWGRHDPYFDIAEVLAYHRALPVLDAHLFDAGHFLLETHAAEVAPLLTGFVDEVLGRAEARVLR